MAEQKKHCRKWRTEWWAGHLHPPPWTTRQKKEGGALARRTKWRTGDKQHQKHMSNILKSYNIVCSMI
jgi:hypothetical protein